MNIMENKLTSEFNNAISTADSLTRWFNIGWISRFNGDYHAWGEAQGILLCALSSFMNDEEKKDMMNLQRKILDNLYSQKRQTSSQAISPELYYLMQTMDIRLSFIHKKSGFMTRVTQDLLEDW